jgi:hypothetical protein
VFGSGATPASTTFVAPYFQLGTTAGAVDITVRIAGTQTELGSFASPYIPTTAAAATREIGIATLQNVLPAQNTGTVFIEASQPTLFAGTSRAAGGVATSTTPQIYLYRQQTSNNRNAWASLVSTPLTGTAATADVPWKGATSWNATTFKGAVGGVALSGGGAAHGATPTGFTDLCIGAATRNGTLPWCGHIRRVAYFPFEMTDAQLQALTA